MANASSSYYLVLGIGRSGMSMARFLRSRGYQVKATDIDAAKKADAARLNALGIDTQIGFHDRETFDRAAAIVVSPGIPLTIPHLRQAAAKGVPIVGELDIFTRYNATPVVAITGTNGKTTVTTLVRDMLAASGISTFMGGNIGTPLVDYLMQPDQVRVVVAEISSFQLDLSRDFTPDVGVLLNLSQDHMDRYDNFSAYAASKWSLFKNQSKSHVAILNKAILDTGLSCPGIAATLHLFSSQPSITAANDADIHAADIHAADIHGDEIRLFLPDLLGETPMPLFCRNLPQLPGRHNLENIAAAALASLNAGATPDGIRTALEAFRGLPHRLTFAGERNGVRYYDDSKATNVDAVIRALESFDRNVFLILGGREKSTDFTGLLPWVKDRTKAIIAIGEAREHIRSVFSGSVRVEPAADMAAAVALASKEAVPGDTVLLSPACASFDMYENYEERGRHFTALVQEPEDGNG